MVMTCNSTWQCRENAKGSIGPYIGIWMCELVIGSGHMFGVILWWNLILFKGEMLAIEQVSE
jgi:hypothetical protein